MDNIIKSIREFNKDRDWEKYHRIKDLCMALSMECSELQEYFLWDRNVVDTIVSSEDNMYNFCMELADVFIYALMIADKIGLDESAIKRIIMAKLSVNGKKYPVKTFKGSNKKHD